MNVQWRLRIKKESVHARGRYINTVAKTEKYYWSVKTGKHYLQVCLSQQGLQRILQRSSYNEHNNSKLYETNIAVLSRATIEIGATHQDGHLSLLRNVHTTDSSLLCYVTGYPRRLKRWEQLAQAYDTIYRCRRQLASDKKPWIEVPSAYIKVAGCFSMAICSISFFRRQSLSYQLIDRSAHGNRKLTM